METPRTPTMPALPGDDAAGAKPRVRDFMAVLVAAGRFTDAEIAERCGCSDEYVRTMRSSPLFMALVQGYRERFAEKAIERVLDDIFADTRENFEWIRGMRERPDDPQYHSDPKLRRMQLRAAEVLFDRQVPKRDDRKFINVGSVVIDQRVAERLEKAAALDVESEPA